jgi:hypothetical protein
MRRACGQLVGAVVMLFATVPLTPVRADTIFDLAVDWSDVANPNGVWSYNHGSNPITTHQSVYAPHDFQVPQPAWAAAPGGIGHTPSWYKSVGLVSIDPTYDIPVGRVGGHASDGASFNLDPANITWTSPLNGVVTVSGGAWMGKNQGRSADWFLYHNAALLTGGSLFTGDPYDSASPFDFAIGSGGAAVLTFPVAVGDTIRFEIVKTHLFGELIGVDFRVTAADATVPEPATLALLGCGGAVLSLAGWRGRRGRTRTAHGGGRPPLTKCSAE